MTLLFWDECLCDWNALPSMRCDHLCGCSVFGGWAKHVAEMGQVKTCVLPVGSWQNDMSFILPPPIRLPLLQVHWLGQLPGPPGKWNSVQSRNAWWGGNQHVWQDTVKPRSWSCGSYCSRDINFHLVHVCTLSSLAWLDSQHSHVIGRFWVVVVCLHDIHPPHAYILCKELVVRSEWWPFKSLLHFSTLLKYHVALKFRSHYNILIDGICVTINFDFKMVGSSALQTQLWQQNFTQWTARALWPVESHILASGPWMQMAHCTNVWAYLRIETSRSM